jgi:hypothetical protein
LSVAAGDGESPDALADKRKTMNMPKVKIMKINTNGDFDMTLLSWIAQPLYSDSRGFLSQLL